MARTRTLGELAADVRYLADIEGATARHPDANLYRLINESWQSLRELCTANGHRLYLTSTTGTLTAGATSGASFGSLPLPASCVRVFALDVVDSNGDRHSLDPIDFSQRNEFQDIWNGPSTGLPRFFHIYNIGTEATTTVTQGTLALLPAPDAEYSYTLWYLPSWTDLTNTSHVFNGVAGWEEWVLWDVVLKICARDNDMQATAAIATQERGKAEQQILAAANHVQRAGPANRVDAASRGRREDKRRLDRFWR